MLFKNFLVFKIALGFCLALLASILVCIAGGMTINITASYPLGLYQKKTVKNPADWKNKLVLICPDPTNPAVIKATQKNILPVGSGCGSWGFAPLMKELVGTPGDLVTVSDQGVLINNRKLRNSTIKFEIFELLILPGYSRILHENEYWVMSDYNPNSFDSRYIGPVTAPQIIQCTNPVLTTDFKN